MPFDLGNNEDCERKESCGSKGMPAEVQTRSVIAEIVVENSLDL